MDVGKGDKCFEIWIRNNTTMSDERCVASKLRQLACIFNSLSMQIAKQCQSPSLQTLCTRNQSISSGFPSHRASNAETFPRHAVIMRTNIHFVWVCHELITLNVRGPSYLGLTRSISWLLLHWLLTSPGQQQPWYWPWRIGRFLSYLRKDFNYQRRINKEKWHKM